MQTRRLGRTNHMSTLVIFGGAAFWESDQATADATLNLALDAGINHIDVAPQYGNAEKLIGNWLPPHRDKFFLGCKTLEREKDAAWTELHRSLEILNTDHFDLYQLHAVGTFEELDKATMTGGALDTLIRAKEAGLTRFLGITGHGLDTPAVHLEALKRFDFDTVMLPINPQLYANPSYRQDMERLLAVCGEREVGVQIIKSVTKGAWGASGKRYQTWYEPYDAQDKITQGVRFALSQPHVTAIPAAGEAQLLPMVIRAAEEFQPMSADEQAALIEASRKLEPIFT